MKHTGKLGQRAIKIMVLFTICLVIGISTLSSVLYLNGKIKDTKNLAYDYAKALSVYIDGDRLRHYLADPTPDTYYYQVKKVMDTIKISSQLKYFYVVIPIEDGSFFIWDATTEEGIENYKLGRIDHYQDIDKADLEEAFTAEPKEKLYLENDVNFGYIVYALYPIFDSAGQPVALVGADLEIAAISMQSLNFIGFIVISIIILVVLFTIVLYRLTRKRIIEPLTRLSALSGELVSSLDHGTKISLDIHTGDEIEELASSFITMHEEITNYLGHLSRLTQEKEHRGTEMHVATSIQASMLPKLAPDFAFRSDFNIFAAMSPAKEVGGDFYDAFLIDQDHLAMVIADVSDKGVPAALFMVVSKTLIKLRAQLSKTLSPSFVFNTVNHQLIENNDAGMFVTVWLAIIDLKTGQGRASNAGHEHPVLCRCNGEFELVEYQHSPPLGCLDDLEFEEHDFTLKPGDTLFVYTDGVAEAVNEQGEQFGTDGIIKALNAHLGLEPKELVPAVRSELDRYVGAALQFDDITMLAFEYLGSRYPE
ncbi:MAG: SpoIIE family protein phosphatase [Succinivibrio sp.]|nr:SpoIIE family protein phosphatase [Succinivibrio sp.]